MYKNQLQELAQRSCFNLPAYTCIREGPDHAPRFKATVNFNGEIFESPNFCSTLRQAEHAAAEVALNTLSKRGPSLLLAAKIIDETIVCKNLLQKTAQRLGVSLPVYTTVRSGPGHLPVFKCTVEVAGMTFVGEMAKTKKQAEKNSAMAAWSALEQFTSKSGSRRDELGSNGATNSPIGHGKEDRPGNVPGTRQTFFAAESQVTQPFGGRSRGKVANFRDRYRQRDASAVRQFLPGSSSSTPEDVSLESLQGYKSVFPQQQGAENSRTSSPLRPLMHHRSHSLPSSMHEPSMLSREASTANRAVATASVTVGRVMPVQMQGLPTPVRAERHEMKLAMDEHLKDDDEWLRAGHTPRSFQQREVGLVHDGDRIPYNPMVWSCAPASDWWGSQLRNPPNCAAHVNSFGRCSVTSLAPSVKVRQVSTVCSAPPPRKVNPPAVRIRQVATARAAPSRELEAPDSRSTEADVLDGEAICHQMLSQLNI
eukprot:c23438_g1_i1 orf=479-1924(+)